MALHSKIYHSTVNYAGDQVCDAQFDVCRSWYWSESVLILQEVCKFRVLRVLPLCRPSLLVVSLVAERRNMSHFITQFYLECQSPQTSLATLWTDPTPVLPSLVEILNHWLKGRCGWKICRGCFSRCRPIAYFSITQYPKRGQFSSTGPDLLQCKCQFFKSLKDLQASKFCYIVKHAYCNKPPSSEFSRERGHNWLAVCDML